jgi:hypothetical protein
MFLEPDPAGYEDSVNHYAGLANNPVSRRDPSGLLSGKFLRKQFRGNAGDRKAQYDMYKQVRPFLKKQGMADLEIAAHVSVLYKRAQYGEKWTIGIRAISDPGKAAERRRRVQQGMTQKPAFEKGKTGRNATRKVDKHGYEVTSDLDSLHFQLQGQFVDIRQLRRMLGEVNGEYKRLYHAQREHLQTQGKTLPAKPNPPYQHEAQLHLLDQQGLRTGAKISESGYLDHHYLEKIGHPGEAYQIEVTGTRGNFNLATRKLSTSDVDDLTRQSKASFDARLATDRDLEKRILSEIDRTGNVHLDFPWAYDRGVN